MIDFSIVVTVKNRVEHFTKIFPSLVTQQQRKGYEIVIVDYHSNDGLESALKKLAQDYLPLFSDSLLAIKRVYIEKDHKFNSGKAKNIGSIFADSDWLSFTDADVFLSMDYHRHWFDTLSNSQSCFFSSRRQETTEHSARRISPKTNYGNMIVDKTSFTNVGGFDENNPTWGGDDDDIIHRLKLSGLFEINPRNIYDSQHTSILHDDELRTLFLESKEKSKELSKQKFETIYNNVCPVNKNFLSFYKENKDIIKVEKIYENA